MKHQRDANGASSLGQAAQITALISDLRRIDHLIEGDIEREEKEAGVFDFSSAAYPIMGRILRVRRNNLGNTIASLEGRLASLLERPTGGAVGTNPAALFRPNLFGKGAG